MRNGLILIIAGFVAVMTARASEPQVTVIDTGSTNRPGMQVSFNATGDATVQSHDGTAQKITLTADLCQQIIDTLKAIGPLSEMPARHCVKSVSFGSSLYIEYQGARSPDLSCPTAAGSHEETLQKSAQEVLTKARELAGDSGRPRLVRPAIR